MVGCSSDRFLSDRSRTVKVCIIILPWTCHLRRSRKVMPETSVTITACTYCFLKYILYLNTLRAVCNAWINLPAATVDESGVPSCLTSESAKNSRRGFEDQWIVSWQKMKWRKCTNTSVGSERECSRGMFLPGLRHNKNVYGSRWTWSCETYAMSVQTQQGKTRLVSSRTQHGVDDYRLRLVDCLSDFTATRRWFYLAPASAFNVIRNNREPGCNSRTGLPPASSEQRWPESLFPTPVLFQNFCIRIRKLFKIENLTPVQTPTAIDTAKNYQWCFS